MDEREALLARLTEALERVLRTMAERSDDPVALLRSLEPELASGLVTPILDGVDVVADIRVRSAIAAAFHAVVGRLCIEYSGR